MNASAPPFTIRGIDHLLLHVNGMDSALKFYENVLGCEVESRMPQYGMIELRAGSSHIALVDVGSDEGAWAKAESGGRNVDHIALAVDRRGKESVRAHLAAHNIEIVEERDEESSYSFYVRDPSGNTIELLTTELK